MGWGWGGNHGGKCAQEVAKAFFEGRKRTVGNCKTDGETYWLFGHAIARRVHNVEEADVIAGRVAATLLGEEVRPAFEVTFAGYPTKTTCAHLEALGLRASTYEKTPRINGAVVDDNEWYSLKELAVMPTHTAEQKAALQRRASNAAKREAREYVYNLTPQLFPA